MKREARRTYACTAMRRVSHGQCEERYWGCSGIGWCDFCWEMYGDQSKDMKSIESEVKVRWK